uniref:Uncharacterized protein n=1 Tax=Ciona savignyi TaxID=51511 RepID=H2YKZ7_CIOSA
MVERTFLKIQREGITSKYLGRINYKPKNRHRESKIDKVIRWSEQHPIVYRALPCSDIEVPAEREMPECLKRRLHESSLAKQANRMVARQKMFGILRTRSPDRMSRLTSPCPSAVSDHYSCGSLSYRGSSVVLETPSTSFLPAATPSSSIFPHTESSCNFRSKTVLGLTG